MSPTDKTDEFLTQQRRNLAESATRYAGAVYKFIVVAENNDDAPWPPGFTEAIVKWSKDQVISAESELLTAAAALITQIEDQRQ